MAKVDAERRLRERVRALIGTRNQNEIARATGIAEGTLSQFLNGRHSLSVATIGELADALGVDVAELFEAASKPVAVQRSDVPLTVTIGTGDLSDFATVDLLEDPIAAGPPMEVRDASRAGRLAFHYDWLQRTGITVPLCVRVGPVERSMTPTITPGEIVLLDCAWERRAFPRTDRIYAINVPDAGATLKRIVRLERGLLLVSDNPNKDEYPTRELLLEEEQESATIIVGEVMWKARPL